METSNERLRKAREKAGFISARSAAARFGWNPSTYASHENGQTPVPQKAAEKYAKAFKTTAAYILALDIADDIHAFASTGDANHKRPTSGILELDVRAGMGGGGITDGREVVHNGQYVDPVKDEAWHFPSSFLRDELRAPERRIQILETQGDSMAPTILSGDRVIIDTGHKVPSPDGIYAIRDMFGGIAVKRLQAISKDPPVVRIISDNTSHDSVDVSINDIEIFGRVLWGLKRL